jgi:hypothetical protein
MDRWKNLLTCFGQGGQIFRSALPRLNASTSPMGSHLNLRWFRRISLTSSVRIRKLDGKLQSVTADLLGFGSVRSEKQPSDF